MSSSSSSTSSSLVVVVVVAAAAAAAVEAAVVVVAVASGPSKRSYPNPRNSSIRDPGLVEKAWGSKPQPRHRTLGKARILHPSKKAEPPGGKRNFNNKEILEIRRGVPGLWDHFVAG